MSRWRTNGVRIIRAGELSSNTAQTHASDDLQLHCVLTRSGQQGLVVNLDIEAVETPELVRWIDDLHK